MNAFEFVIDLLIRGVTFMVDGDRLRVRDPHKTITPGERALLKAIKPMVRALLLTELPKEQAEAPCPAFSAGPGIAICRDCGHSLPAHYWRTSTCEFFVGTPAADAICRRCAIPWLEHNATVQS